MWHWHQRQAGLPSLAADGKLPPGMLWRQASIIGSVFEASFTRDGDKIIPTLRGGAHFAD